MTPRIGRGILVVMAPIGWFLASVFGVLACMLAADARGHDAPGQILGALVLGSMLGSMLASVPVGFVLYAAYRGSGGTLPSESLSSSKLIRAEQPGGGVNWRWPTFAILYGLETLVLPLTFVAAAADGDTLMFFFPFNLVIVTAAVLVGCWPHRKRARVMICAIHLTGIAIATFAAAIEIESVIISGPLVLISGLALALVGTRPWTTRNLFAFSTVAFIVTSFLVIAICNVGLRQAEANLFAAMVAYQILFAPIGLWLLYREFSAWNAPFRVQFGLTHLIAVMVIVCLTSGLAKLAYSVDGDLRIAVAVGIGALVMAGIAAAIVAGGSAKWIDDRAGLPKTNVA